VHRNPENLNLLKSPVFQKTQGCPVPHPDFTAQPQRQFRCHATIGHDSRDGSKIIRRTISGSEREIFPRIRWTGERCTSSSRSGNDRVFVRGATTGVLGTPGILAFVLMIVRRYKHPENSNPAIAVKTRVPDTGFFHWHGHGKWGRRHPRPVSIHEAAKIMAAQHIRQLPIMKKKKIAGIITARDLVEAYAK
jgi:hypothetical protein